MRIPTCLFTIGIVTSLAWAQAPSTAPAKTGAEGKPGAKPASRIGMRSGPEVGLASNDRAGPGRTPQTAPQPARDVREILNTRIPVVHFDHAPLESVMDWVQETSGLLVYVRYPALEKFGITRETPITVKARDQKLSRILWIVMNEAAGETGVTLAYQASSDLLLLSTHADLGRKMITRTYDIQAVSQDVPYFWYDPSDPDGLGAEGVVFRTKVERVPSPQADSPGHEVSETGPQPPQRIITTEAVMARESAHERALEFAELILNTIEPKTWEINGFGGEGTIFPYKGRLIIRNNLYVHKLIDEALNR